MKYKNFFTGLLLCIILIGCAAPITDQHEKEHEGEGEHEHEKEQVSQEFISEIEALEKKVLKELDFGKCKTENIKDIGSVEICNYEIAFNNEEDLKKQFPNLEPFKIIDGYQFNKINISLDKTVNVNFEKIIKWSDFNRFSFELIKDEINVVNLTFAPTEFLVEKPMEIKDKKFNDINYKVIYNPNGNGYEGIMVDTLINNKKFYIAFTNYNNKNNELFLEENKFISLIDKLLY